MMPKDFPTRNFNSPNLFLIELTLMYDKIMFLGKNALRLYNPSNDDTSVLGEAGKDFPNQNECKKSKKLLRIAFPI